MQIKPPTAGALALLRAGSELAGQVKRAASPRHAGNLLRTQTLGYLSNANGADKKLPRPCIRILGGYLKEVPLHGWRGESRLADA